MKNHFCKYPLWEVSKDLADVAMGRVGADVVIQGATLVNVCTRELMEQIDVAIVKGRIALVGDASHCIKEHTIVHNAHGKYLAPAFLDAHIHVESSMLTVSEYAKSVLVHGTSGIFMDPHEICNVLGLKAVEVMIEDSKHTPLKTMVTTPSCVPAVAGFEDIGSEPVTSKDIAETMKWDEVVGLGEMMNFPGITFAADEPHKIVQETLKADKIATGHYSIPETGAGLNAYIASGVRCCHESTRAEDAIAKMRLGMYALFREGSAWKDLKNLAAAITEHKVDSRYACLISDDTHPNTLISDGHLNHILKKAVAYGIDPIEAIQMVTINAATCFQLEHDMGSIAPGKCADIVLLDDLKEFKVLNTWVDGTLVSENGKLTVNIPHYEYPAWTKDSVHVKQTITADIFDISSNGKTEATVRVMEVGAGRVSNTEVFANLQANNGSLSSDPTQDVLKVQVFERHHATGLFGQGFVKGFGIQHGAMASTVAHDAHNLLVVGSNDEDMALAANTLIESKGGMVAVQGGKVLGHVALPIAGIMSQEDAISLSEKVESLEKSWEQLGCTMPSPFMTMALIPLACLPDIRLTNKGLVDCRTFAFTNLIVE